MSSPSSSQLHVLFPHDGEAWAALAKRMLETEGEIVLILSGREQELLAAPEARASFLADCKKLHARLRIATKHPAIAAEARSAGIRVLDRTQHLRALLHGHLRMNDALRAFSPQLWRQQLKTRLQRMGLLSVPKVRIFSLVGLSGLLFFIVVFRLLPSADIMIRPRQESVSQAMNIFLVQSGAQIGSVNRVRQRPLVPIRAQITKSITFDHVSKEFIGTSSRVRMTVVNKSGEEYALRSGTRFTNQAGMIFRLTEHAIIPAGSELTVNAKAEDLDLFGEIIGDRGNVPAGLKWDIPGLAVEERTLVYGENREAAAGGTTAYRTILRQEDLELARKRLEQELLNEAKQKVAQQIEDYNAAHPLDYLQMLDYNELTSLAYRDFVLPTQFLDQVVTSVPVSGSIEYVKYAYDSQAILGILQGEMRAHVREGRKLVDEQLRRENLDVRVIEYDDSFSWIKITVELIGTEEYILDPLSPTGALFGKSVRDRIAGKPRDEALRIIRNMPEVERVEITQWPPWNRTLPRIPAHISILPL